MVTSIKGKQHSEGSVGPENEDDKMGHDRSEEPKTITIEVNSYKVKMLEGPVTGLEIKEAAIKQNVEIQPNFVLHEELPNGTGKIIGDDDKIQLRDYLSFTAITPDDNS